jgi:hypothetical protein
MFEEHGQKIDWLAMQFYPQPILTQFPRPKIEFERCKVGNSTGADWSRHKSGEYPADSNTARPSEVFRPQYHILSPTFHLLCIAELAGIAHAAKAKQGMSAFLVKRTGDR